MRDHRFFPPNHEIIIMKRTVWFLFLGVLCSCALTGHAQSLRPEAGLAIVHAGPQGEVATLAEASEIRIVFSEPMVSLGRIPARVQAPFFKIDPAVRGTFRWSGTTILIFTPDPKRPLSLATTYQVTIAAGTAAVSGRKLASPLTFTLTTPTARLLRTESYRRGDRFDGRVIVALRFNQPVRPPDVLAHATARFSAHSWVLEDLEALRMRLKNGPTGQQAVGALDAKVAATRAAAAATGPVQLALAAEWDKERFPPAPDLVVLETVTDVPPESWVRVVLDEALRAPAGPATPGMPQEYTVKVAPAFFIERFDCVEECNPDAANPLHVRPHVRIEDFANAISAKDVTAAPREIGIARARPPRTMTTYGERLDLSVAPTLEDAGFDAQPPARTYAITIGPGLRAADGQTLGYTWVGTVENWHRSAFTSFGDGHGVWETGGGTLLPFYARNFRNATEWAAPLQLGELMPAIRRLQGKHFTEAPAGPGTPRPFSVTADRVQSHGLDLSRALAAKPTGIVWAAVRAGEPIPQARFYERVSTRASLVQVTNLGITVKDSPQNTLVFVTRLDTGAPVAGANVSIVQLDNRVFWRGTTGADGIALAPDTALRGTDWWKFAFIVTAEKDGDAAYVGSDWNEGVQPWDFSTRFNLHEASPMLRGTVFTDRGVYRLGEEIHFKAVLRENGPPSRAPARPAEAAGETAGAAGIRLLPAGTPVLVSVRDSQHRVVDSRTIKLSAWSSAEWTMTLPAEGSLGTYSVQAILERDKPKPKKPEELRPGDDPGPENDEYVAHQKRVNASFLVAAYRRPDFRVDVALTGTPAVAGSPLNGVVKARYLFGAAMGSRPVSWKLSRSPVYDAPAPIKERFPDDRWDFVGYEYGDEHLESDGSVQSQETTLTKAGTLPLRLVTLKSDGRPWQYALEGDVEDVSRQHIANRAAMTVHPAPWYIGVKRLPYFAEQKNGVKTEIIASGLDGVAVAGVPVELKLTQIQWQSVRRAEGGGFYTWDTNRIEVPIGTWTVTTGMEPIPFEAALPSGGNFVLTATGRGDGGLFAVTQTSFYALGDGYTAWARFDHNRIELVPERKTWKPGDTARIMIQSPWEQATALLTTEREGIRTYRQFALTSTQQSVTVPITEADIPNVFVSVLLVKGRTRPAAGAAAAPSPATIEEADASDPGKPAFRLGYIELKVEDATKRLTVAVKANKDEYRPANAAKVDVDVKDRQGRGASSEVTLWAVDYGVLSLTAYRTPDVLKSVYVEKALQVMTTDNRQRIVSRRVLTPKGSTDGGGGGADPGSGTIRKDFRVLAFWLGSVTTDAAGHASVDVKLPESLTTYRIMAVAADRASRFGSGDSEVRINKPITMKPAYPRFLAVGDTVFFGAVVTSQLQLPGTALVTMKSLDPAVLDLTAAGEQSLPIGAGGSVEARFQAAGRAIGRARVRMTVRVGDETDAFEDIIPVEVLASPETVAAYGETTEGSAAATELLTVPRGVVSGFGGLHIELASTAMVGLGEGARYLVEYPYGCAEQKGSRALAMLLAADLGDAFSLPGVDTSKMHPSVQATLKELETFQCPGGGFAYWPGQCRSVSPYLTAYLLHVFKAATDLKYQVDAGVRERAYAYLETELAQAPPENEGWWPSYTAWQAFAVKVLAEGGRNQDSNITRLYGYRERMPVFALAYLHDALAAKRESSPRTADLRRRMTNAILLEGGSAHVEELSDPHLLWFWNSNVRSTAIVLNSLVRAEATEVAPRSLVRWLMTVRKNGRWGNTQENAHAMEALVAYYRKHESAIPDFRATVALEGKELARQEFKGRSSVSVSKDVPMAALLAAAAPAAAGPVPSDRAPEARQGAPLTFSREGSGTLFYTARLRYAADRLFQQGLDSGFRIERSYAPYVEAGFKPPSTTYKAGDLVQVTLTFRLTKERRFVAVTDPLPAGFEPVESWFATTARSLSGNQDRQPEATSDWMSWWQHGGFDHVERHDDRIQLFATRLSEGLHTFLYIVRATTAGSFRTAPAHAEEMYEPEVFGRTATAVIEIR
jgi:alpha-2-macroglobulin